MKQKRIEHGTWMDLSAAAEYLGVHFTTLRRWADAGEIRYLRTPGKRRRFSLNDLEAFLLKSQQGGLQPEIYSEPLQERAIDHTRASLQNLTGSEKWLERISHEQRVHMKGTGQRLMALLLQFNSRADGGEAFLEEGKRIIRGYSQVCASTGLSLLETVHVFLFFRRSILDAVHETNYLNDGDNRDGLRIYDRTTQYLDDLILELIGSYPTQIPSQI